METRFGRLSLQANGREDIFAVLDVIAPGFDPSDETFMEIADPHFESSSGWLNGKVPVMQPVDVEGDTTVIRGWFQGERYVGLSTVWVYIEYEEVEQLIGHCVEAEAKTPEERAKDDWLEQKEVIL